MILRVVLLVSMAALSSATAGADPTPAPVPSGPLYDAKWPHPPATMPSPPQIVDRAQLKVLKVFVAKDGDALFRSYLVQWRGQEVTVEDTLRKTDYHVGDIISV